MKKKRDKNFLFETITNYKNLVKNDKTGESKDIYINLVELDFCNQNLTGLSFNEWKIFNFEKCSIKKASLDRNALNYFQSLMRDNIIEYGENILSGIYLGPQTFVRKDIGLVCKLGLNFDKIDIRGFNLSKSDIRELSLEDIDIESVNFIGCQNFNAKQFAFAKNFDKAFYYSNQNENTKFISKISKIYSWGKPKLSPKITNAHSKLAQIFDKADEIRKTDPYLNIQNKI